MYFIHTTWLTALLRVTINSYRHVMRRNSVQCTARNAHMGLFPEEQPVIESTILPNYYPLSFQLLAGPILYQDIVTNFTLNWYGGNALPLVSVQWCQMLSVMLSNIITKLVYCNSLRLSYWIFFLMSLCGTRRLCSDWVT